MPLGIITEIGESPANACIESPLGQLSNTPPKIVSQLYKRSSFIPWNGFSYLGNNTNTAYYNFGNIYSTITTGSLGVNLTRPDNTQRTWLNVTYSWSSIPDYVAGMTVISSQVLYRSCNKYDGTITTVKNIQSGSSYPYYLYNYYSYAASHTQNTIVATDTTESLVIYQHNADDFTAYGKGIIVTDFTWSFQNENLASNILSESFALHSNLPAWNAIPWYLQTSNWFCQYKDSNGNVINMVSPEIYLNIYYATNQQAGFAIAIHENNYRQLPGFEFSDIQYSLQGKYNLYSQLLTITGSNDGYNNTYLYGNVSSSVTQVNVGSWLNTYDLDALNSGYTCSYIG